MLIAVLFLFGCDKVAHLVFQAVQIVRMLWSLGCGGGYMVAWLWVVVHGLICRGSARKRAWGSHFEALKPLLTSACRLLMRSSGTVLGCGANDCADVHDMTVSCTHFALLPYLAALPAGFALPRCLAYRLCRLASLPRYRLCRLASLPRYRPCCRIASPRCLALPRHACRPTQKLVREIAAFLKHLHLHTHLICASFDLHKTKKRGTPPCHGLLAARMRQ